MTQEYRECGHRGTEDGDARFTTPCAHCDARIFTSETQPGVDLAQVRLRTQGELTREQLLEIVRQLCDNVEQLRLRVPLTVLTGPITTTMTTAVSFGPSAAVSFMNTRGVTIGLGGSSSVSMFVNPGAVSFGLALPKKV